MDLFGFLETLPDPLERLIQIALVIVIAIVLRVVLVFVIRRVVNQVVTGVKKKHKVDDTRELEASPLAAVRLVQRTRSLGSVFSNGATALIVGVSILLIFTI